MLAINRPKKYRFTRRRFRKRYPDDATCLEWLRQYLYPNEIFCQKCQRVTKHHRVASRPSYSCDHCGHHVHPTAATIFHKSHTPLTTWFYAIYLMARADGRISAKQIQRKTGVTYKTAWRMVKRIRSMLEDEGGTERRVAAKTPEDVLPHGSLKSMKLKQPTFTRDDFEKTLRKVSRRKS